MTDTGAIAEKVRRLEADVRELEGRVEDAHADAQEAARLAKAAYDAQVAINTALRATTAKAEAVDKVLKQRMHDEEIQRHEAGARWQMISIAASLGLFAWSLVTGKISATLEYIKQFAGGGK